MFKEVAQTTSYTGAKMDDDANAYERITTVDEDKSELQRFWDESRAEVAQALYGIRKGQFVLMLQHIPEMWKDMTPSRINEIYGSKDSVLVAPQLTLSGHTHAGQVSVLGLRPSMFSTFDYGLYEREGCQLYTTAGLGGTIPIRIGATPEIVVITLKRK